MISFANGVWPRKNFFDQLEDDFLKTLDTNYLADFEFLGPDPVTQVNDWVNRTTRGKINRLVGQYTAPWQ